MPVSCSQGLGFVFEGVELNVRHARLSRLPPYQLVFAPLSVAARAASHIVCAIPEREIVLPFFHRPFFLRSLDTGIALVTLIIACETSTAQFFGGERPAARSGHGHGEGKILW